MAIQRPPLRLDLDLPPAERFKKIPKRAIEECRALFRAMSAGKFDDEGNQVSPQVAALMRSGIPEMIRTRTEGRFDDEIMALERVLGADWRLVTLVNCYYDMLFAIGCSTMALPTPEGPLVARNMDFWPEAELARATWPFVFTKNGEIAYCHAGWAASVGVVTGLSANGFAVVLNAVGCVDPIDPEGYPVLLHLRRVLEDADGFQSALDMLKDTPLIASALFTLVGLKNEERVVVERAPGRYALRWGETGKPLVTTNHYRSLLDAAIPDPDEKPCERYSAMSRYSAALAFKDVPNKDLLGVLTDQEVCQTMTAQHIIMRPWKNDMSVYVPEHLL